MATIAIIDDNIDQSETVQGNISMVLESMGSDITVISTLPFKNIDDYFPFIDTKNVCTLIIDEKLNDKAIDSDGPVAYKGSELVLVLRKKLKEFPIFTLTVIPTDPDLKKQQSQYEAIISRDEFYKSPETFVPIFARAVKSYLNNNIEELSKYQELSVAIAGGNTDPNLISQLQALQIKLELPYSGYADRTGWLDQYEEQIKKLENLNDQLKAKITSNK